MPQAPPIESCGVGERFIVSQISERGLLEPRGPLEIFNKRRRIEHLGSWTAKLRVAHTTLAGVTYPSERLNPKVGGAAGSSPIANARYRSRLRLGTMADSTHRIIAAVSQAAKQAFTQARKRLHHQAHDSANETPPTLRRRGNDCSTVSLPTKVVVQAMPDGTTALVRVPVRAAHSASGSSATQPTSAIVPHDSGRLHARRACGHTNRQDGASLTHAPTPAEIARAAAVMASQRPAPQQPRRTDSIVHVTLGQPAQLRSTGTIIARAVAPAAQHLPMAVAPADAIAMATPAPAEGASDLEMLTTAAIRAAVDQARASQPRITRDVAIYLAEGGAHVTGDLIEQSEVVHEVLNLVVMLPAHALANICGLTTEAVHATPAQRIIKHALRKARHKWVPTTLAGARRAWARLPSIHMA